MIAWIFGFAAGAALVGAGLIAVAVRCARALGMWDQPNARSLHGVPIPRGAGAGIIATIVLAIAVVAALRLIEMRDALGAAFALTLIACVGWRDDARALSVPAKLLVQLAAAGVVLWSLGVPAGLKIGTVDLPLGAFAAALYGLIIVWLINLYNFMDGADGLAATEALMVCVPAAIAFAATGLWGWALVCVAAGSACAVFLHWNWAPASVFMGDAGSGALGTFFALIAIVGERTGALPLSVLGLLLGTFLVDATLTLVVRMSRGAAWWQPHRQHLYQRAIRAGARHGTVVLVVASINVLVCWPAAWMAMRHPDIAVWVGAGAASIMVGLWYLLSRRYQSG